MKLTKVAVKRVFPVNYFMFPDGHIEEFETTKEDFQRLLGVNPQNPTMEGAVWYGSSGEKILLDTPDEKLSLGQYAELGEYKLINVSGRTESVPNEKVSPDGTLL